MKNGRFFVDMLLRNSIFARVASNRYISRYARNSICCLWQRGSIAPLVVTSLALSVGQRISSALAPYRVVDISSDASAAHIDVESSWETHDGLNMGGDSKRSQNGLKMGVVIP